MNKASFCYGTGQPGRNKIYVFSLTRTMDEYERRLNSIQASSTSLIEDNPMKDGSALNVLRLVGTDFNFKCQKVS